MRVKISAFIILCFISYSCEKDVKNGLPEFEPKLVVTSFLSTTDKTSTITVTSNRPALGLTYPFPNPGNLTGWISDGENRIELNTTDNGFSFSRDEMPIISGKTYNLEVTNDQGLKATASCTVPEKFDYGLRIDTSTLFNEFTDRFGIIHRIKLLSLTFNYRDQPDKKNYYSIIAENTGYYQKDGRTVFETKMIFDKSKFKDKDELKEDNNIILSTLQGSIDNYDSSFMKVYLLDLEESYYLYHKSLTDFKDDDNPFTEPTIVYTNVEGGLGVFTSFSVDSMIFRLK
jgi:hypothetical protein